MWQEPSFPMVVVPGQSLTKAATATVIFDQVIEDIESIAAGRVEVASETELHMLTDLLELLHPDRDHGRLPRLRVPEFRADLHVLATAMADARPVAHSKGVALEQYVGFGVACQRCGVGYYVAEHLVEWFEMDGRDGIDTVVIQEQDKWSKSRSWTFPEAEYGRRVRTYGQLLALIQSS
ncbi:hypothetical protein [Nocardioides sp. AE5]|uniref:hypothetical protein n=1 Tax=Nocardioides sp. AE5 TaxID=2962573 RepID=UPI002881EB1C|nr:hypothetical protein [Nocardioides sp. AE5]MDT0201341.1 hypothetical protein [Nocardioides sp. AE5]